MQPGSTCRIWPLAALTGIGAVANVSSVPARRARLGPVAPAIAACLVVVAIGA
ncbi:MAG TPA: hypothetical protein VF365_06380 [Candidatus Limnocylindria bacterium]